MKQTLKELHEICEAMDNMEIATSEIQRIIIESDSDITIEIFKFEYPFKRSWDDLINDVHIWTQIFRKSTAEHKMLLNKKENKENYNQVNLPDIMSYLYHEDYTFKLEYECPQYNIKLEGDNDNILSITNSLTDDGEECIIHANEDEVFRSQDTEIIKNQIRVLSILIGAH